MKLKLAALSAMMLASLALTGCGKSDNRTMQGWVEADLIFVGPDDAGRVESLSVREGDKVSVGTPLFTVDPRLQEDAVKTAEAALLNAHQSYDRAEALVKTAAGTQATLDSAKASLRMAEAQLATARTQLARRSMSSPVIGSVEEVYYRPGELVPAGKPIVALLPPQNLKIRFFVPESTLPSLKYGETVAVSCDGCEKGLTAKVSFIARSAEYTPPVIYSLDERAKLVFLIEALPENPEKFRVGQPVSVTLPGGASP
jgi:HlyD family secretion protein